MSGTVMSYASGLPRVEGMSVAQSGLFLSVRDKPTGSLVVGFDRIASWIENVAAADARNVDCASMHALLIPMLTGNVA